MSRLQEAFTKFDGYNRQDPNQFIWEGISYPQEYFLALKLYDWVLKLAPNADEALLLASRSQHIGRWEIPRNTYPEGREGYLKWRKDLSHLHAARAGAIMLEVGYDEAMIDRVQQIILKQKIKVDTDVQTIENALCLVFLQYQYEDFYPLHNEEKVVNILRKSLLKMDAYGHEFALSINYSEKGLHYIQQALELINNKG
jgi:tetratricopeptide (TPR) repeat protein